MRRLFLVARFVACLPLLLSGCIRDNAGHCGNQAGDNTCAERDPQTPFCNVCTATNDGCVAGPPASACAMGGVGSGAAASSSTGRSTGAAAGSGESASTASSSGAGPGPSSSGDVDETTGPSAMCGDGQVEGDEQCDGPLEDDSCAAFRFGEGTISCGGNCQLDTSNCSNPPMCGNGVVEPPSENCEPDDPSFPQACEEYDPAAYIGGTVICNACTVDTSNCDNCIPANLTACTPGAGQCCPGLSCNCVSLLCSCTGG